MTLRSLRQWIAEHPARAGTLGGWYQQACGVLAALVVVPLVMKLLTTEDAGLWFCFQNMLAIINLTDFGLTFALSRQVSYSMHASSVPAGSSSSDFIATREGWLGLSDIYGASRALFRRVSLVAILLLVSLYEFILPFGKLLSHATPETHVAWYLLGAATLFSLQAKPDLAVIEGLAKIYLSRFLTGSIQVLIGLGVISVLLFGGHLMLMALVVAALSLAQYLAAKFLVRHLTSAKLHTADRPPPGLVTRLFRVAAPMGILNVSSFCVSSIQVPLLGFLLGPQVVPGFFLAQRIGQMLNQAVMQTVFPQLPLFTREVALRDGLAARSRLRKTVAAVTFLAIVANLVFYFFSPVFVHFWIGPRAYLSSATLAILALDYALCTSAVVWAQFVLAGGSNPFVLSTVLSGIMNLLLNWLLVPRFGVLAAALSGLITGLAINYWFVVYRGVQFARRLSAPSPAPFDAVVQPQR